MPALIRYCLAAALLLIAPLAPAATLNTTTFGHLAVDGYDVVAYHTEHKAVKGLREFRQTWQGAIWQFASAAHQKQFAADPARYAPQYGGYCAYAVGAKNELVDIDPEAFTLVGDKLYLNYSKKVQTLWEADRTHYIEAGDRNWPALSKP